MGFILDVVDEVIQNCPINVCHLPSFGHCSGIDWLDSVQGFWTSAAGFLRRVLNARLKLTEELNGNRIKPKPVDVEVVTYHHMQHSAM